MSFFSLADHPQGYETSLRGFFSDTPVYARRHEELSRTAQGNYARTHYVLSWMHSIPLAGSIFSVMEAAANATYRFTQDRFTETLPLTIRNCSASEYEMLQTMREAVRTHTNAPHIPIDLFPFTIPESAPSLQATPHAHTIQKPKGVQEDSFFTKKIDNGLLLGIFDGHRDNKEISQAAADYFSSQFEAKLRACKGNVLKTFENLVQTFHESVLSDDKKGGACALICYVDTDTNRIYTSTLGDCEAKIYRKYDGRIVAIPLSVVGNWANPDDFERARSLLTPTGFHFFKLEEDPRDLRVNGINVARAFGDAPLSFPQKNPPTIIQKTETTMCQLQEGDLLVLASDGVWDIDLIDLELIQEIFFPHWDDLNFDFAEAIAQHSKKSNDDVTAISLKL